MAGGKEIDSLELRKRTLVLESNLNRLTLEAEWQNLQSATVWVNETARTFRQLTPWLALLGPLVGFLTVRGARQPGGTLCRLLSAGRWILRLRKVWRSFSGTRAEAGLDKPAAS